MSDPTPQIIEARDGHGFGRLKRKPDTRDWQAEAHLPRLMPRVRRKRTKHFWSAGEPLDQGNTPQCVAFSGLKLLYAGPVLNRRDLPDHDTLYAACQANDEWPGSDYDGTSSRGLMRALQQLGYVTNYAFTQSVETLVDWTLYVSPVCVGTLWTWDMDRTQEFGGEQWLNVPLGPIADADIAGGHEWTIFGAQTTKKCPDGSKGAVRMINSWGVWGDAGTAWVSFNGLRALLLADGDCVMPTEVKLPKAVAA